MCPPCLFFCHDGVYALDKRSPSPPVYCTSGRSFPDGGCYTFVRISCVHGPMLQPQITSHSRQVHPCFVPSDFWLFISRRCSGSALLWQEACPR
ncbi:hypothetical protein EI94DRAFT_1758498 [Lactarius quietus]|nr:hypothetical protein EI94DRAFT_1758498 [Lactarius quietus]